MTEAHCDEPPQDQYAQTPLPPPPPVQQATPLTVALQVPPLLQVLGAVQTSQVPSVPVQPASQFSVMQPVSVSRATARMIFFTVDTLPRLSAPTRLGP